MPESEEQIDRNYLYEISGGDDEFERDLVQTFFDAAPSLLSAYAQAIADGDSTAARIAAHTLKGSSRSIGAARFAAVCEEAEKAARLDDLPTCASLAPQIDEAYKILSIDGDAFLAAA